MKRFLITGVKGQVGSYLLPKLSIKYGKENIIATDLSKDYNTSYARYVSLDVTDEKKLEEIIKENKITNVIHLASILSALAEKHPDLAKKVNIDAVVNLFELSRLYKFQ